ncbi:MAG: ISL3 family transposase [Pseudobdellovibrionaceae bacterium]
MAGADVILNRLCDLQGTNFEVVDCQVKDEEVIWWIQHKEDAFFICPRCEAKNMACHDTKWITLRDVPFGKKSCKWMVKRARILCSCSMNVTVEKLSFRSSHHKLTQRFVDYIEQVLCSKMFTVADVARLFDLDYGIIYKIDHEVLRRLIQELEIPDPINIAVDEKSFKKGHNYVTIVTDCDLKKVIWVSIANTKESLDQFFQILGPERCARIKTVSKDLHKPYALSCSEYIPHAIEVADPFHVVKKLNETMDECRKELSVGSVLPVSKRKAIFKLNWVLRYKQENQSERNLESLEQLAKINEPLYMAYLHKESFYDFFTYKPSEVEEAKNFLIKWIVEAFKSKLKALQEFAEYIKRNVKILLNIILTERSSAISEGINRKVQVIKSMAYGYKNIHYFMLKIMQRCGVLGAMWKPANL